MTLNVLFETCFVAGFSEEIIGLFYFFWVTQILES